MSVDLECLAVAVVAELFARGGKERGGEIIFRCPLPGHPDEHPSCRYNRSKKVYVCDPCAVGGGLITGEQPLVPLLGINPDDYQDGRPTTAGYPRATTAPARATAAATASSTSADKPPPVPATVAGLAAAKGLPEQFLRDLGVSDNGPDGVMICYRLQDGTDAPRQRIRKTLDASGSRWAAGDADVVPYGLERLGEGRA